MDKNEQVEQKIHILMMNNGDEILGRVYETDEKDIICIEKPLIISRYESENGFNIHLNKWVPYSDDTYYLVNTSNIMTHAPVTNNLVKFYSISLDKIEKSDEGDISGLDELEKETQEGIINIPEGTKFH